GLVQVAGGLAILAGIALSSLPLIAAGRMSRRAALVVAARAAVGAEVVDAGTGAGAATGAERADAGAGRVDAGAGRVGPGSGVAHAGAEFAWRTRPPSPRPAAADARVNECGVLPDRFGRTPHSLNFRERHEIGRASCRERVE